MFETPPPPTTSPLAKHRDELFIALQRLAPQHTLSRLAGRVAESRRPWLKNFLIARAMAHYGIDLDQALIGEPSSYDSFNAFFTRRLEPHARPVDDSPRALVAPADGVLSQSGDIRRGTLIQAKGFDYSIDQLLGLAPEICAQFHGGSFATLYLAPSDYHRVHMPFGGKLRLTRYVPGQLFSVNTVTAAGIANLFTRNERLTCLFETDRGPVAVVLVGALLVAGIETVWQKHFVPGQLREERFENGPVLGKGEELGLFRFGSTVIVVTAEKLSLTVSPEGGHHHCRMGERLGEFGG